MCGGAFAPCAVRAKGAARPRRWSGQARPSAAPPARGLRGPPQPVAPYLPTRHGRARGSAEQPEQSPASPRKAPPRAVEEEEPCGPCAARRDTSGCRPRRRAASRSCRRSHDAGPRRRSGSPRRRRRGGSCRRRPDASVWAAAERSASGSHDGGGRVPELVATEAIRPRRLAIPDGLCADEPPEGLEQLERERIPPVTQAERLGHRERPPQIDGPEASHRSARIRHPSYCHAGPTRSLTA